MSDAQNDPSLGSTSNSTPESVIQEADDLAKGILQILDKHGVAQAVGSETLKGLMIDFSIYMVNRDQKILQHGVEVGREQAAAMVAKATEIPKDAKEPTRDFLVVWGEQMADRIRGKAEQNQLTQDGQGR